MQNATCYGSKGRAQTSKTSNYWKTTKAGTKPSDYKELYRNGRMKTGMIDIYHDHYGSAKTQKDENTRKSR
jgi:hypothetical protein